VKIHEELYCNKVLWVLILVTVDLVRKRSEHNEGEISTLEEIALHQENIDKIEGLDKWCRELKILLLQSNLIPKIGKIQTYFAIVI
jgi:protein TilB